MHAILYALVVAGIYLLMYLLLMWWNSNFTSWREASDQAHMFTGWLAVVAVVVILTLWNPFGFSIIIGSE